MQAPPPRELCILRLSALGDVTHVVPVVRTLQRHWPATRITWIVGQAEQALLAGLEGVEFVVVDKRRGPRAWCDLRRALAGRRFDVLFHMQMSLRASLYSTAVRARIRVGFDRARAKDLQWLFTNRRISAVPRQHVLESFFEFPAALGLTRRELRWDIPIPEGDRAWAARIVTGPALVISPCSSFAYRNWLPDRYAAVARHAATRHGMQVVLSGGDSAIEREYARAIRAQADVPVTDLVGRTTLKQVLALLERATALVAPDSGPAHMATAVGTPVIGLYACTNPDRARPYLSAQWTVNRYPEALRAEYGLSVEEAPWGRRVRAPHAMARITVGEVTAVLDRLMSNGTPYSPGAGSSKQPA